MVPGLSRRPGCSGIRGARREPRAGSALQLVAQGGDLAKGGQFSASINSPNRMRSGQPWPDDLQIAASSSIAVLAISAAPRKRLMGATSAFWGTYRRQSRLITALWRSISGAAVMMRISAESGATGCSFGSLDRDGRSGWRASVGLAWE